MPAWCSRRQRWTEVTWTPRMRAMVVGDSPSSNSATARRRRRSNSAALPMGLVILHSTQSVAGRSFDHAGLSKDGWRLSEGEEAGLRASLRVQDQDDARQRLLLLGLLTSTRIRVSIEPAW